MFSFDADAATINIYDEIGPSYWGLIDAQSVIDALAKMEGKHATIRLNTPGGSVDEGIAIFNALKRHKGGVTTIADSLAASMGSYLLQAGERRLIASNAMVMIHDPWSIAIGNSAEFRKAADVLDKYAQRMIPDYAARSGKTEDEILDIMAEESWYTGQEAVDAGFADEIDGSVSDDIAPVVASLHRIARKAPASLFAKREAVRAELDSKHPFPRLAVAKQMQAKLCESVK